MKILSITSLFPNCKEPNKGIFVLNRLKALNKYADIEVIAPVPWFPFRSVKVPYREKIEELNVYHPKFFSIPMIFKFLDGWFFSQSLRRFRKKIKQADIIDSHFAWPDGYGSWLAAKKHKKKFSVTLRGKDVSYWMSRFFIRSKIKKMLKKADIILSVSQNLRSKLKDYNVKIIPNGVDTVLFKPENKNKARKKIGLNLNKKIFLTVGNDFRRKGYFELVKAFDKLDVKDKLLLIIGYDKKEFRDLKNKISKLENKENIKMLKEIPNQKLSLYYSAADVYCLASHLEGWPNSVMEALACGKPCVVTKEAAGEFITEDLGIITDYEHLTEDLEKALNKRWNKQKILNFAKENIWDKCAGKVYDEFQKSSRNHKIYK